MIMTRRNAKTLIPTFAGLLAIGIALILIF